MLPPPLINQILRLDLHPEKSFIKWAVDRRNGLRHLLG